MVRSTLARHVAPTTWVERPKVQYAHALAPRPRRYAPIDRTAPLCATIERVIGYVALPCRDRALRVLRPSESHPRKTPLAWSSSASATTLNQAGLGSSETRVSNSAQRHAALSSAQTRSAQRQRRSAENAHPQRRARHCSARWQGLLGSAARVARLTRIAQLSVSDARRGGTRILGSAASMARLRHRQARRRASLGSAPGVTQCTSSSSALSMLGSAARSTWLSKEHGSARKRESLGSAKGIV